MMGSKQRHFASLVNVSLPDQDVYICPNNAMLRLHTSSPAEHARRYQAEAATRNACPLKAQCTPGTSGRYVSRNFAEEYFERVRSYQTTEAYKKALRKRSVWVESLFAEGKDWHGMRRFRSSDLGMRGTNPPASHRSAGLHPVSSWMR